MKTFMSALVTGAVLLATALPAQAQNIQYNYGQRERVIQTYCDRYPSDRDCRGYYGGGWNDRDYDRFYGQRRSDLDGIAAGLFGFTFGAIIGGAIANSNNNNRGDRVIRGPGAGNFNSHTEACYARYRSYDERTDTYLGYDGRRHLCNL